jgi:hypothetical protein
MDLPKRLYKFGRTTCEDVLDRFNIDVHYQRNWRGVPLAEGYDAKVLWSKWVTKQEAVDAEKWFKSTFPKTFFVQTQYNGITECRDWKPKESYAFLDALKEKFPDRIPPKTAKHKIYYVMLTKKQG